MQTYVVYRTTGGGSVEATDDGHIAEPICSDTILSFVDKSSTCHNIERWLMQNQLT